MGAIHEKGLAIPGDISVVGFDDIELSAYTLPALTTVHVPRRELASTAFRALFRGRDEIADKNRPRNRHVIKTKAGRPAVDRRGAREAHLVGSERQVFIAEWLRRQRS